MWDRSVPAGSSLLSAPRWASAAQRAAFRARAEFPKKDLDLQAATSNPALSPQPPTLRRVQICAHAGTGQFLNLSLSVALSDSLCLAPSLPSSPHAHAYFKTRTCKFPKANHITTS